MKTEKIALASLTPPDKNGTSIKVEETKLPRHWTRIMSAHYTHIIESETWLEILDGTTTTTHTYIVDWESTDDHITAALAVAEEKS